MDQINNFYYVGPDQPYLTVNQALEEIATALYGGNFQLPPDTLEDGGQVNIVIRGAGKHLPFSIPDNTTPFLRDENRFLIIRREEYTQNNALISNSLPVFSPEAEGANLLDQSELLIGCNIGNNNPNVKLQGIRVEKFVIGIKAGFNCDNLYIQRNFVTNCINAQIYISDLEGLYMTNNICVGGQYGMVMKFCKKLRAYHNTVFVDGSTALNGEAKAGFIVQGERQFASTEKVYFLGNLAYTVGCPAVIFYDEDLRSHRLISNYNNLFAIDAPLVQLRSDASQLENEAEVVAHEYFDLSIWTQEEQLGEITDDSNSPVGVDQHSISTHPIFITTINSITFDNTSILDLQLLGNSPMLAKVPSWYFTVDTDYIPTDFNEEIISKDSLLNTREKPFTAIGANDSFSLNGFFGQDIFTNPLSSTLSSSCDVDPLQSIAFQNVDMIYPEILPGFFYSNERKFYLYAKKGAHKLGHLVKAKFSLPGFLHHEDLNVTINGKDIPEADWDLAGRVLCIYTRTIGISTYEDIIRVDGLIRVWTENDLSLGQANYEYTFNDASLSYVLPEVYKPVAPVVITDDRVNYRDPEDLVRRDFKISLNKASEESEIVFGGNHNLIKNPQFDISYDGISPAFWTPTTVVALDSVLANRDYAYVGDYSCALMCGSAKGGVESNYIKIRQGDDLTYSFHAMFPETTDISSGAVTGHTLYANIDFYNANKDKLTVVEHRYTVPVQSEVFNRYYVTIGDNSDCSPNNLFESSTASLINLFTGLVNIPDETLYTTIKLEAKFDSNLITGSFIAVDGIMAERSKFPTAYSQEESFYDMTVEFETSEDGKFVDRRMNLSSIYNQNPNGFLYIRDMPASIWGGPEDIEITSLHEYRWPEGRLVTLPWARLIGKDKLTQKSFFSNEPTRPISIIEPFNYTERATSASLTPSSIVAAQDDLTLNGFNIQVLDSIGNPYSLRNFTASIFEEKDQFPGWLSKTYYGAKEQLGTTIYGSLNEHGSAIGYYIPPESSSIRYSGPVPKVLSTGAAAEEEDHISFIKTNYSINKENNGNISIRGLSGKYFQLEGTRLEGSPQVESDSNIGPYMLTQYPPVLGSVELYINSGKYIETVDDPNQNEYLVDYNNAQIFLSKSLDPLSVTSTNIKYIPKYAYKDPKSIDTIIIHHNQVFDGYSNYIEVDYDASIFLEITAKQPVSGEFVDNYNIVIQNPKLAESQTNGDSLDF